MKYSIWFFKGSIIRVVNILALTGMLHSTVAAPVQSIAELVLERYGFYHLEQQGNDLYKKINYPEVAAYNKNNVNQGDVIDIEKAEVSSENNSKGSSDNILTQYFSDITEGIIGCVSGAVIDDGNDNLFNVNVDIVPQKSDRVFLDYDLYGVQDFSAVSHSINNRAATGGYIVKTNQEWSHQKEEIDGKWLHKGDNNILFSLADKAKHYYKIRNLKIVVEKNSLTGVVQQLVVPQLNNYYEKDGKMFIKGFIRSLHPNAKVSINGTTLKVEDGEFEGFVPNAINDQKFILVSALDEKGLIGQITVPVVQTIEADFLFPIEEASPGVSGVFNPDLLNNSLSVDGATITLDEGSINSETQITITPLRAIDIAPLEAGMINVTSKKQAYRFTPDGMKFEKPVQISLEFDTALIPDGYQTDDIRTFYYNTHAKRWVVVETDTIDCEKHLVVSITDHFTDYINGIIKVPESPQTSAFAPTIMNDIKAADPSSNITLISPPEASQSGDANISYPIKLPSGRKGMQPQLALQYSSEGGDSWVGNGWNLNIPGISIDTRWGVPTFGDINSDGDHTDSGENIETEIYSLSGEQLMYPQIDLGGTMVDWMPNRHYGETNGVFSTNPRPRLLESQAYFTFRKQGSFAKIQRLGNSPSTYYWKVTGTDGTINWYGGKVPQDITDNKAVIKNPNGDIVFWALFMTEDVYGNNVKYLYENSTYPNNTGTYANLSGGKMFYPMQIIYTGFSGGDGNYKINFIKSNSVKSGVTINARNGFKQIDPYLLDSIDVKYKNALVRSYKLNYRVGRFSKTLLTSIKERDKNGAEFYSHTFDYYDDVATTEGDIYFTTSVTERNCQDECFTTYFPIPRGLAYYYTHLFYTESYYRDNKCSYPNGVGKVDYFSINGNNIIPQNNILYMTHFKNHALTNLCPSYPIPIGQDDYITQNTDFISDYTDYVNYALAPYDVYGILVLNYSGVRVDYPDANTIINKNVHFVRFYTLGTFDMKIHHSMTPNYQYISEEAQSGPVASTYIDIPATILVSTTTGQQSFGPYLLSDINDVALFQQEFQIAYPGTPPPTVNIVNEQIVIDVPSTDLIFTSINVIAGGINNIYEFTSCGESSKTHTTNTTDWNLSKPTKEDIEMAFKKNIASGKELDMLIPNIPLKITIEATESLYNSSGLNKLNWLKDSVNYSNQYDYTLTGLYTLYINKDSVYWQDINKNKITDQRVINTLETFFAGDKMKLYTEFQEQNQKRIKEDLLIEQDKAKQELETIYKANLLKHGLKETFNNLIEKDSLKSHCTLIPNPYHQINTSKIRFHENETKVKDSKDEDCPPIINEDMILPIITPSFYTAASILGSTKSTNHNVGGYLGAGIGLNPKSKKSTFGFQYNHSWNITESFVSFIDIDGDGLDDIVRKSGNSLYYKKHLLNFTFDENNKPIANHSFSNNKPITGISEFLYQKGSSNSGNFQATFGIGPVGGFAGIDGSFSKSETNIFFTDANGDGLIDISKNGTIFFNYLIGGIPTFIADSKPTENMVIVAHPKEIETPVEYFNDDIHLPGYDVVKVWEALTDGEIKIENSIELTDLNKKAEITIEKNDLISNPISNCFYGYFPIPHICDSIVYRYSFPDAGIGIFGYPPPCNPNYENYAYSIRLNNQTFAPTPNYLHPIFWSGISVQNSCPDYISPCGFFDPIIQNGAFKDSLYSFMSKPQFEEFGITNLTTFNNGWLYSGCANDQRYFLNISNYYPGVFAEFYSGLDIDAKWLMGNSPRLMNKQQMCVQDIGITCDYKVITNNGIVDIGNYNLLDSVEQSLFVEAFQNYFPGNPAPQFYFFNYSVQIMIEDTPEYLLYITIDGPGCNGYKIWPIIPCDSMMPISMDHKLGALSSGIMHSRANIQKENEVISRKDFELAIYKQNLKETDETTLPKLNEVKMVLNFGSENEYFDENEFITVIYRRDTTLFYDNKNSISDRNTLDWLFTQIIPYKGSGFDSLVDEIKIRRAEQLREKKEHAQSELNKYYASKYIARANTPKSTKATDLDNTCNYIPTQLCPLFGAILDKNTPIVQNTITNNNQSCDPNSSPLHVKKGDRIYFRIHNSDGGNSVVNWNPKVEYTNPELVAMEDQNGIKPYTSSYSDGFILSKESATEINGDGTAVITWDPISINNLSDNVTFEILKRTTNAVTEEILVETPVFGPITVAANTNNIISSSGLGPFTITGSRDNPPLMTSFIFKIKSTSNVNWKQIDWKPKITSQINNNLIGQDGTTEANFTIEDVQYPIVDLDIYKTFMNSNPYNLWHINPLTSGTRNLLPVLNGLFDSDDNGVINFVLKSNGHLIGKRIITVSGGVVSLDDNSGITLPNTNTDIEIGFYSDDSHLALEKNSLLCTLSNSSLRFLKFTENSQVSLISNSYSNLYQKVNPNFGHFYRQWGQFMYNPEAVEGATPIGSLPGYLIKEDAFGITETQANQVNDAISDLNDLGLDDIDLNNPTGIQAFQNSFNEFQQNSDNLVKFAFISANPSREMINGELTEKWTGLHQLCYSAEYSSSAAGFDQEYDGFFDPENETQQEVINTGAYSINKYTKNSGLNLSAGGNLSVGITSCGITGSKSINGISHTLTDYVDMNGDRYPDILSKESIQASNRTGGLLTKTEQNSNYSGDLVASENGSWGGGATGSFGGGGESNTGVVAKQSMDFSKPMIGKPHSEAPGGNTSIGISGNFSKANDSIKRMWLDINGDGLSDLLTQNGQVVSIKLNYGNNNYNSNQLTNWGNIKLSKSNSTSLGGGVGFSLFSGSIEGGIAKNTNNSSQNFSMQDINGDGLLDWVEQNDDKLNVSFNSGIGFSAPIENFADFSLKDGSSSSGESQNVGVTWAWITPIFGFNIKFPCVNVNYQHQTSTNRAEKLISDFDGDGFPDFIEEIGNGAIKINYSTIRRTNKLKAVHNPLGGTFIVDYQPKTKDYDNPNAKWVMSELKIADGYNLTNDGADTIYKSFEYDSARYDRREREFYGFKTVKTIDYIIKEDGKRGEVYRTSESKYYNNSYFLKGLLKESKVYKGSDPAQLFTSQSNVYILKTLKENNSKIDLMSTPLLSFDVGGTEGRGTAIVLLKEVYNRIYELSTTPLVTKTEMNYDELGRVTSFVNYGDLSTNSDDYTSTITYYSNQVLTDKNIINIPSSIIVSDGSGMLRTRTTGDINNTNGNIGKIITTLDNSGTTAETKMEYDTYGNLSKLTLPENLASQKMTYTYTYDADDKKNIISVVDAPGYTASFTYDQMFDVMLTNTDITGNRVQYVYDNRGRVTKVIGPNEAGIGADPYTLKFEYFPTYKDVQASSTYSSCANATNFMPVAISKHYDPRHSTNSIDTYTFIDGLARPVQVKKDIEINTNTNRQGTPVYTEAMSVSGKTEYDVYGRAIQQFHPVCENSKACATNFVVNNTSATYSTRTDYDELDRPVLITDPDGKTSTFAYSLSANLLKTRSVVDQNGVQSVITEVYKDASDKQVKTINVGPSGNIITTFIYNSIGELLSYTDADNLTSSYTYDKAGRKLTFTQPDNGTTTYQYDKAGNLSRLKTANLNANGTQVEYTYNYNRLTLVKYPDVGGKANIANTTFQYGAPGTGNKAGRLIYQSDASGNQTFDYDKMGNVSYNQRVVVTPSLSIPTRTFKTYYTYDSWNRLLTLKYPDNEIVNYWYNRGGNVDTIVGQLNAAAYYYVKRVDYDYYEQRTYIKYGNGTETMYDYTPSLRRLSSMNVKSATNENLILDAYRYDNVGNITSLTNTATYQTTTGLGGTIANTYSYDVLNRLSSSVGNFVGKPTQPSGNDNRSNYTLAMAYGNTGTITTKTQLHSKNGANFAPNTYTNNYTYISGSHKLWKLTDQSNVVETFSYDNDGNVTRRVKNSNTTNLYWDEANRLRVVAAPSGAMQHYIYDASGERVVKGNGSATTVYVNGTPVSTSVTMTSYTTYPSGYVVVDGTGTYSKHYYMGTQRIASRTGDGTAAIFQGKSPEPNGLRELQQQDLMNYASQAGIKTVEYAEFKASDADEQIDGDGTKAPAAIAIYYYHPDHLGSNTLLTDMTGKPYQLFLNLPFGETMAEQFTNGGTYLNKCKFNGKELDTETGLYYYGARYYDPRSSVWLGVDPLVEKYPNKSPYNYCSSNPLVIKDDFGLDEYYFGKNYREGKKVTISDGKSIFSIPMYSYSTSFHKENTYWFKWSAEQRFANSNSEIKNELMFNQADYISINSPMTIQGGDGNDGFNSLHSLNVMGKVEGIVQNWKTQVGGWQSMGLLNAKNVSNFMAASGPGGIFDFKKTLNLDPNSLYEINGVYYNANEAGNYYWGYAAGLLNISQADMNFGAQEFVSRKGRRFDEPWEVDAFNDGWMFRSVNRNVDQYNSEKAKQNNIDMYGN